MKASGRGTDGATAVDQIAPQVIAVIVSVALRGTDKYDLSGDLTVDAKTLHDTTNKNVTLISDILADASEGKGVQSIANDPGSVVCCNGRVCHIVANWMAVDIGELTHWRR